MSKQYWKLKVLALFVSSFFSLSAHAINTSDYDCSYKLTDGVQSIRSVTLTEELYRCFQFDNYADLAVVNADQQLVPFTLSSQAVDVKRQEYKKEITFFKEPQESSYRTGNQIRRIAALTGVVSRNINDQQWQSTNVHYSSFILQQPGQGKNKFNDKLLSVTLNVDSSVETEERPIRATVVVEVSDDLQNWRTQSKPHNLYFLLGKEINLNSNSVTLNSRLDTKAKYFRLAILSNVKNFADRLRSISGTYQHIEHPPKEMQWITVAPYEIEQGVWQFELPSLASFTALKLTNADSIVYYQGRIFAERHKNPNVTKDNKAKSGKNKLKAVIKNAAKGRPQSDKKNFQWRNVTSFNRYKLVLDNGSIESPSINFSKTNSRLWKIQFNQPASLNSAQLPKIELGWQPLQLNFIAQGRGPFVLLAGRQSATKKVAFPSHLQRLDSSTEKVELLRLVQPSEQVIEHPIAKLESTAFNWGQLLLWAILLLGVCLMLYMAFKLTRKMNDE